MSAPVRTVIFGARADGTLHLAARTERGLRRAGLPADVLGATGAAMADGLRAAASVWLVREGAWPAHSGPPAFPPPSRTGRPLCALGAVIPAPGDAIASEDERRWHDVLRRTGGDLDRLARAGLPPLASVYLEAPLAREVGERLSRGESLDAALSIVVLAAAPRVVRYAPLDVHDDRRLRVAHVVTSLQQGGAERVAADLAEELPRQGVSTLLVALGAPTRATLAAPPPALDLRGERTSAEERIRRLLDAAHAFGADVVHGHLLEGPEVERLAAGGIPLVLTMHNVRAGWPAGTEQLRGGDVALIVACSRAAEADLVATSVPAPARTVWNGVDFARLSAPTRASSTEARARLGLGPDDLVLVVVANPRPQKRLDRLPAVLAATGAELRRRGLSREVLLVVAGGGYRDVDRAVLAEVAAEAARHGVQDKVRLVGSVDDVPGLLAAADVLVSTSAYEGLSLAHIEAIASGLPLVATAVGGTPELAHGNPAVLLAAPEAPPETFAARVVEAVIARPTGGRTAAAAHFTRERMAQGYVRLYPRAVARGRRRPGDGLLLVTNNFSTGGAQSSARRLLLGLRGRGLRVRAAVLQEQPEHPTPGRRALAEAGVDVAVLPRPEVALPEEAIGALFARIDADPPAAILLWNALAAHKLLLADGELDIPIFDASPGEMYYQSLDRYFEQPRPGLPYRAPADYGARLAGVIVKYRAEAERAARVLGAPVHVVPNGVPCSGEVALRTKRDGPLVIGTLARLDPRKKVDRLLDAIALANGRLPPHVLRIAGGVETGCEPYVDELRQRSGASVEWVGEVDDPAPFLGALDLFALVAEPEGCPNASLEAMSAGLPVVATNAGGIAEQIVDGVTGHVVDRDDTAALAEALVRLAWDPEGRARLGLAAADRVRRDFHVDRMVEDYRRICLAPA